MGTAFTAADLPHGAQWMYYGGDLVAPDVPEPAAGAGFPGPRLTGPTGALGDHHRTPAAGGES